MAQPVTAVRDWLGKESPLQATISYDFELNGNQSISATILPSEVNRRFIADLSEMWTVIDHFGVEQKIVYLQRRGQGEEQSVQIKGIPLFFDVMNSSRIYERLDMHMTAQEAFNRIFDTTGFTFVLADSFSAVEWEGFGEGETRLDSFKRALDRYGAEFYIRGKQVTLKKLIGRDLQTMYAHRLNASNITLEHDASALWTYAKGFGDYGDGEGSEDWQDAKLVREYTSPLAQIIGIRHAPPIKNGNITTVATMDEQLKTLVDESLKISVTADIHDLRKQGYPIGQPEVGDRVYLVDERIGFNEQVRVVDMKLVLDWRGDVRDINLTFGTPGLSRRYQARVSSAMGAITDLLDGKIKLPPSSVYDDAMRNAVNAIQNAETELTFPTQGGIIAVDKNNPNKQVWLNSAGIMVSVDAGATAKAAITGEGVVTEMLTAGTINSNLITIAGGNRYDYTQIQGGKIRSEGRFDREFGGSQTAEYHAYTESWNGVYRAGLISKTANGQTLDSITRWTALTDKGLTTQRAIHSGSADYKGARFIDFFADETLTSNVFGQGMHIYSGQDLLMQSEYRTTIKSGDGWYTHMNGAGVQINADGAGLVLRKWRPFGTDPINGGNYISLQASDGVQHAMLGIGSNDYNLQLMTRFGDLVRLRSNKETQVMNTAGGAFNPLRASTLISQSSEVDLLFGRLFNADGITYVQAHNDIYATRYKSTELIPVRAAEFNIAGRGRVSNEAGTTFIQGNQEVRATMYNSGTFVAMRALDFLPPSSTRETKKDIEVYGERALDTLRNMEVYSFRYNVEEADTKKRLGVMLDEAPEIIHSAGGDTVEMYSTIGFVMKAVKDSADEIDDLKRRIEQLEGATT